jgi:hypothetical protein
LKATLRNVRPRRVNRALERRDNIEKTKSLLFLVTILTSNGRSISNERYKDTVDIFSIFVQLFQRFINISILNSL